MNKTIKFTDLNERIQNPESLIGNAVLCYNGNNGTVEAFNGNYMLLDNHTEPIHRLNIKEIIVLNEFDYDLIYENDYPIDIETECNFSICGTDLLNNLEGVLVECNDLSKITQLFNKMKSYVQFTDLCVYNFNGYKIK